MSRDVILFVSHDAALSIIEVHGRTLLLHLVQKLLVNSGVHSSVDIAFLNRLVGNVLFEPDILLYLLQSIPKSRLWHQNIFHKIPHLGRKIASELIIS